MQRKDTHVMADLINLSNYDVDETASLDGYDAYDAAGNKLGDVDSVIADSSTMKPRYLVVDSGGWFSSKKFVVPVGDVKNIHDNDKRVYFSTLTKDTLQGGTYPAYDESWWDQNQHEQFAGHEREVARAYQPNRSATAAVDHNDRLYQRPAQGAQRLQLMEERLNVDKQRYHAGEVKVGKRITEHTETVNVPVREERVIIERTTATGQVAAGDRELKEGETIEVPVMAERVNVTKEPVVTEQVNIRKEATERTETAQDTVRREELVVDGNPDGAARVVDGAGNGARVEGRTGNGNTTPTQTPTTAPLPSTRR
jgi:uncharacterized protein (TIGR02271 family)